MRAVVRPVVVPAAAAAAAAALLVVVALSTRSVRAQSTCAETSSNCFSCTNVNPWRHCGWCPASATCVRASNTTRGPLHGTCAPSSSSGAWSTNGDQCAALTTHACTPCLRTCAQLSPPTCGWCRSAQRCFAGTRAGPAAGLRCDDWLFDALTTHNASVACASSPSPSPSPSPSYTPVVLLHGIGSTRTAMLELAAWLERRYPTMFVRSVELQPNATAADSLFVSMNTQVAHLAAVVAAMPELRNGFNLIGHSQGGLTARAYVVRYQSTPGMPRVRRLISLAGPQDGVFGVPEFNGALCSVVDCPWLAELVSSFVDNPALAAAAQHWLSFAAYWRANLDYERWLVENEYLVDINNLRPSSLNSTYRDNMRSLERALLVYAELDRVVVPRESPWFSFFPPGTDAHVAPFNATAQYTHNLLGLRDLYDDGRLALVRWPLRHAQLIESAHATPYWLRDLAPLLE